MRPLSRFFYRLRYRSHTAAPTSSPPALAVTPRAHAAQNEAEISRSRTDSPRRRAQLAALQMNLERCEAQIEASNKLFKHDRKRCRDTRLVLGYWG